MNAERQLCSVCGLPWQPWAGSKLKTHGRCHFPPAQQDEILARYEGDPTLSMARLGAELGVTPSVVQATIHAAQKRRKATRAA